MRATLLLIAVLFFYSPYTNGQSAEEINVKTKAGHSLAGTLTLPSGKEKFPCIILITGSGPQDRNEEILGHKPFEAIALYMQSRGVAVFRYDDRGIGNSTGDFGVATSADFALDASEVFDFISTHSRIDASKVGFAGHSEGGMIAAMASNMRPAAAFVISLAGTGVNGKEILSKQSYDIAKKMGLGHDESLNQQKQNEILTRIVMTYPDSLQAQEKLMQALDSIYSPQKELIPNYQDFLATAAAQMNSDWMRYFIAYEPSEDWRKVKCPVLILNGSEDVQVNAQVNMNAIAWALQEGGNEQYKLVMLHGQNHLFQNCVSCTLAEYGTLAEDFSLEASEEMLTWLNQTLK